MSDSEETVAPKFAADPAIAEAARRVMERCEVLGGISDEELPRLTRTFLSPAAKRAQEEVAGWMREAGLSVHVDAAGNVIGRRDEPAGAKTFVMGSHLDTVPNAGKYDGILGVMAGIAVAELLRDVTLPFALEVVGFSEEEGVRFGRPYIGSHAYAGTLDAAWLELKDKDGVTVEEAIRGFGLEPAALRTPKPRRDLLGYLEVHIEQGPELDEMGISIGPVTAIAGQTRTNLLLKGIAGHAGTTPMGSRRDALTAAAEMILRVEKLARDSVGRQNEPLVATVGQIRATPNATNVIPGEVQFSVDMRHPKDEIRARYLRDFLEEARKLAEHRGVTMKVLTQDTFPAVQMNGELTRNLMRAAWTTSGRKTLMISGAGHDSVVMAGVAPTAMLFVRSPGGISHHPQERVYEDDVVLALATCVAFLNTFEIKDSLHDV